MMTDDRWENMQMIRCGYADTRVDAHSLTLTTCMGTVASLSSADPYALHRVPTITSAWYDLILIH